MAPLEAVSVPETIRGRRIVILVGGGIAAYKIADLVSQLVQAGCQVRIAATEAALRFVGRATFAGLSGHRVLDSFWDEPGEPHVELGDWAELVLVAPATADLLARMAHGLADDLVTAVVLAARCPVLVAPAMNDAMWSHPAVAGNLGLLRARAVTVIEPEAGRLASGHLGPGRLAGAQALVGALAAALDQRRDLAGRLVVVTAGGTREPIDRVRFISNYSSGKMGYAMAVAAAERGAEVVLVTTAGHPAHAAIEVRAVETAVEMLEELRAQLPAASVLVMAAAVADFRSARVAQTKLRREEIGDLTLELEPNPDLLAELAGAELPSSLYRLGFAAEDSLEETRVVRKLERKRLDAIVGNDISRSDRGFGGDANAGVLIFQDGTRVELGLTSKREMAERIWTHVVPRLPAL